MSACSFFVSLRPIGSRQTPYPMHRKRAHFPSMHSLEAPPRAYANTCRENAPIRAHLHLHAVRKLETRGGISRERLVSVDAKCLSAWRISPAAPKGWPRQAQPSRAPRRTRINLVHRKAHSLYHNLPPSVGVIFLPEETGVAFCHKEHKGDWRWGSTPCPERQAITSDWPVFGVWGGAPAINLPLWLCVSV